MVILINRLRGICPLMLGLLYSAIAATAAGQIRDLPIQHLPATAAAWTADYRSDQFPSESIRPALPSFPTDGYISPVTEAAYPQSLQHSIADDYDRFTDSQDSFTNSQRPPQGRDGFFQMASVTGTWMPSQSTGDFGQSDIQAYSVFALPAPSTDSPLLFTPFFAVRYLDGPVTPDLPSRVYDASLQVRWLPKLSERFRLDLAFEPGLHGDFQKGDDDAIRFPGHALGILEWAPGKKLVLGLLYLDREDINYLPAGGLILNPRDGVQLDLIFPKPKIAWRYSSDGNSELWAYFAAEFGGGPYSIQRASGVQDVVIQTDYRLLYGIERKRYDGMTSRIEIGYVLGRELDYVSATPDYEPNDTFIVRGGVAY